MSNNEIDDTEEVLTAVIEHLGLYLKRSAAIVARAKEVRAAQRSGRGVLLKERIEELIHALDQFDKEQKTK